jgi:large subunit ribosomal protein L23
MHIYEVVRRPLVTEKGSHQSQRSFKATAGKKARGGSYSFEVHPEASKPMVKLAVERIYNVQVLSVRTSNRKGKRRRVRFRVGETRHWKKAVVVLHADSHIDLF